MGFLKGLFLIVHLLTVAGILLLCFVNAVLKRPFPKGLLHLALTMVVTGVMLVGLKMGLHEHVNHAKIAVKFAVLLAILALVWVNSKRDQVAKGFYPAVMALTVINIALAYGWH
jgi:hypothetical protein